MALALGTAAVAASIVSGMYIEGKFSLLKDADSWYRMKNAERIYQKAVKDNRQSLYYLFEESVKRRLNNQCIWSREYNCTWSQAYELIHQYGNWFLSQGITQNDIVAFYLTNSPDTILAWLGLWSIGAAPAMINSTLTGNGLLHSLSLSGAKILLVDEDEDVRARVDQMKGPIKLKTGMTIVSLVKELKREIYEFDSKRPDDVCRSNVKANSSMALFYTSGTTGLPKCIPFSMERAYRIVSTFLGPEDRWYICTPLYHATGGAMALSGMINGNSVAIGKKFSLSKFWQDIHDSQATWICYVGEIPRYLLTAPPSSLDIDHKVKGILGNGLRPDVWFKFRDRFKIDTIVEFFNSSEGVLSLANYCRGDYLATAVGHHGALMRLYTRNLIVPVKVDNDSGDIVRDPKSGYAIRQPYEVGGEILLKLPSTEAFPGYLGDDKATDKKFARNVFQEGDLWYRSGDSLRRTSDGRWFFLDRLGDTYRWRGENVSTAEVAEALCQYPGIVDVNVYGVSLPKHDGKAGCAAILIDPALKYTFDFAKFLRHNRTLLTKHAVPIFLRVQREMSLTHNYKQSKTSLKAEGVDPDRIKGNDEILWAGKNGKGMTYEKFLREDWEDLKYERARL